MQADDLKGMNYEQMGNAFGGGGGGRRGKKPSKAEYKTRLEDFYKRYGMEDKVRAIDACTPPTFS